LPRSGSPARFALSARRGSGSQRRRCAPCRRSGSIPPSTQTNPKTVIVTGCDSRSSSLRHAHYFAESLRRIDPSRERQPVPSHARTATTKMTPSITRRAVHSQPVGLAVALINPKTAPIPTDARTALLAGSDAADLISRTMPSTPRRDTRLGSPGMPTPCRGCGVRAKRDLQKMPEILSDKRKRVPTSCCSSPACEIRAGALLMADGRSYRHVRYQRATLWLSMRSSAGLEMLVPGSPGTRWAVACCQRLGRC
jgi:hypothetical protein